MKEVTFTFRYTGDAETWDEIREDAEQGKIKSVFIGKKEFVNAELIAELEAQLPKDGEWIELDKITTYCSNCNWASYSMLVQKDAFLLRNNKTKYCPNCGARMKKGANDEQTGSNTPS